MTDSVVRHYAKLLNTTSGWTTLYEGTDGWDLATIRFYQELYETLSVGGTHRNNAAASLSGFEIIHAMYQSVLSRDRVSPPIASGAEPLEELMGRSGA